MNNISKWSLAVLFALTLVAAGCAMIGGDDSGSSKNSTRMTETSYR